jgi:hypothetical protein
MQNKKPNYKIIDNFLSPKEFKPLKDLFFSSALPWYCSHSGVAFDDKKDGIYFNHTFYDQFKIVSNEIKFIESLVEKIKCKALIRVKANLYPKTPKIIEHGKHRDYDYKHKSFIFYINTNNGFTRLQDGTKIDSVENRGLFFEGWKEHNSSSCTDQNSRMNINFCYF